MDARARSRKRSHWGWGSADRAPDRAALEAIAPEVRRRLGFGGESVEEPVPLGAIDLAPPRLRPPESLGGILSDDPGDRIRHSMGRAYRDVVRGFRGRFVGPPTWSRSPPTRTIWGGCSRCAPSGGSRRSRSAAAPASSAGSSRASATRSRRGLDRPRAARAGRSRSTSLARRADPGRHARPRARGRAAPARAHAPALPAVVRVLDARRLDRDAGRRPLRDAAHPHRRLRRVDPGDHAGGAWSRAAGCPGSGAGPSPERLFLGSEGALGVITEAWMRVQPRPRFRASARGRASTTFADGAEAARAHRAVAASTRRTAACSTRARR